MRFANILVCHSVDPTKLFDSIPYADDAIWYVFLHGEDSALEARVRAFVTSRNGNLFPYKVNRGLSRSWNDAIHLAYEAGCDAFFLLNDDLFFYPGAYVEFKRVAASMLEASPQLSCVTVNGLESGVSAHSGQIIPQWFACCALSRSVIDKVGYFDQNFSPAYFEDVDYARRAALAGMTPHVIQQTLVEHERSSTTRLLTPEKQSALATSFEQNRTYFERKWGGGLGNEKFQIPFGNSSFDLKIAYNTRDMPYGTGFDVQRDTCS